nr:MAG TPA: hypothetical protein [Caudoviricetes sp.]
MHKLIMTIPVAQPNTDQIKKIINSVVIRPLPPQVYMK